MLRRSLGRVSHVLSCMHFMISFYLLVIVVSHSSVGVPSLAFRFHVFLSILSLHFPQRLQCFLWIRIFLILEGFFLFWIISCLCCFVPISCKGMSVFHIILHLADGIWQNVVSLVDVFELFLSTRVHVRMALFGQGGVGFLDIPQRGRVLYFQGLIVIFYYFLWEAKQDCSC